MFSETSRDPAGRDRGEWCVETGKGEGGRDTRLENCGNKELIGRPEIEGVRDLPELARSLKIVTELDAQTGRPVLILQSITVCIATWQQIAVPARTSAARVPHTWAKFG